MPAHALLAELLLPMLLAPAPAIDGDTVELTIVEHARGAKPSRTRMELPVGGKVELWIADGDERRFCEAESAHDVRRGELFIALRCRATFGSPNVLAVQASPQARKGMSTTLAKLERADGRRLEVTARLR